MYLSFVSISLICYRDSLLSKLAQFTCPSAHAHNGVDERKHQHFLEVAHALMIAASLAPHFWVEVVSTFTYLVNISAFLSSVFLVIFVTTCVSFVWLCLVCHSYPT